MRRYLILTPNNNKQNLNFEIIEVKSNLRGSGLHYFNIQ